MEATDIPSSGLVKRRGLAISITEKELSGSLVEGSLEETRRQRNLSFSDRARTIKRAVRPLNIKMHQRGKPDENRFICLGEILAR